MTRKLSAASLIGLDDLMAPIAPLEEAAVGERGTVTRLTPDAEQIVVNIPLASIKPNPHQPRRTLAPESLQELADSIAEHGRVIQPVLVRPAEDVGEGDTATFELVAGERRWRASEIAGMPTIRAIVEGVDNATSAEMALAENMAREDLNPMEEAHGCAALRDSFGLSVAEIGRRVGRDRTAISHLIRLLELPQVAQELIAETTLSEGHGRVLLRLGGHEDQRALARRCADAGWSVRELERQVDSQNAGATTPADRPPADLEARLRRLSEELEPVCGGSAVQIVPRRKGAYEIRVACQDLDVLAATVQGLVAGG